MRLALVVSILTAALTAASQAQTVPASAYNQPLRPQVHFSPAEHWMNDPNGPIYFEGEYHLFFQYNPFGLVPAKISWGHAVSPDLLHWQQLPVAIPATDTELVFTGSVVADERNTSGLCLNSKPCLVAVYTSHNDVPHHEAQALAVSQDRGRTWQRFSGNPVLDLHLPEFRDPSVTWSDEAHAWLMAVSMPSDFKVAFYTSPDLKHWTPLTTFGPAGLTQENNPRAQWECPTLLHIPADAPGGKSMWALKVGMNPGSLQGGSGEQYFLGQFDGKRFTPSAAPGAHGWTDYGKDAYCSIPFNHLPAGSQPTLIGWMDNWQYADKLPTTPWRGQMTLPRSVTVAQDSAGLTLRQQPIVAGLRTGYKLSLRRTLAPGDTMLSLPNAPLPSEIFLNISPADAEQIGLCLFTDKDHFIELGFDLKSGKLFTNRTHTAHAELPEFAARTEAPLASGRPYDLHIILDRSSVEVFAQEGTLVMTTLMLPAYDSMHAELFRRGGKQPATLTGSAQKLESIWPRADLASGQAK